VSASSEREINGAIATLLQRRVQALVIIGDPLFYNRLKQLAALTTSHAIPAIYTGRDFPDAGGLMSYGASQVDADRDAGTYVG
jgi:ABC-type uncharacterized transport system substrate-binding protein